MALMENISAELSRKAGKCRLCGSGQIEVRFGMSRQANGLHALAVISCGKCKVSKVLEYEGTQTLQDVIGRVEKEVVWMSQQSREKKLESMLKDAEHMVAILSGYLEPLLEYIRDPAQRQAAENTLKLTRQEYFWKVDDE